VRWDEFEAAAPELAAVGSRELARRGLALVGTVRRDGSPRISAVEPMFAEGDLWIGSMWHARKALDLLRDPRLALHSASEDPPVWRGDAKLSGRAEEVDDDARKAALVKAQGNEGGGPPGNWHLFRIEVSEAVLISVAGDKLVIELWREREGLKRLTR
jgi:hypothetical protein